MLGLKKFLLGSFLSCLGLGMLFSSFPAESSTEFGINSAAADGHVIRSFQLSERPESLAGADLEEVFRWHANYICFSMGYAVVGSVFTEIAVDRVDGLFECSIRNGKSEKLLYSQYILQGSGGGHLIDEFHYRKVLEPEKSRE